MRAIIARAACEKGCDGSGCIVGDSGTNPDGALRGSVSEVGIASVNFRVARRSVQWTKASESLHPKKRMARATTLRQSTSDGHD